MDANVTEICEKEIHSAWSFCDILLKTLKKMIFTEKFYIPKNDLIFTNIQKIMLQ